MIYSAKVIPDKPAPLGLSIFTPNNKLPQLSPSPDTKIFLRSAKNSSLTLQLRSPDNKTLQSFRFVSGEALKSQAHQIKYHRVPTISKFEIEDEEKPETVKVSIEMSEPTCRICLDSENNQDLISPCLCKGSQKYVHQTCLQLWLLKSEKIETDITNCEVCKTSLLMQFVYSSVFSPCNEFSCKAWIPFIICCIMIAGILCFYFQGYISGPGGMLILAISCVFAVTAIICLIFGCLKAVDVCVMRKIIDWKILDYEPKEYN